MNEEELRQKYLEQQQLKQQQEELEKQLEMILWKVLTPEAKQRLNNVKLANRQLYLLAAQNIVGFFQSNKAEGKINEEQVKELLETFGSAWKAG